MQKQIISKGNVNLYRKKQCGQLVFSIDGKNGYRRDWGRQFHPPQPIRRSEGVSQQGLGGVPAVGFTSFWLKIRSLVAP